MQQITIPPSAPHLDLATLRSRQLANPRLVLVESLPASYYASGHLPGARHLPHDATDTVVGDTLPDRTAEIVTYCASATCPNSHLLAARLLRLGYERVAVFADGKAAWAASGASLER